MQSIDVIYLHPSKHAANYKDYAKVGSASPYMLMPVGVPGMVNLLREHGFSVMGLNVPMEILIDSQFCLENWLKEFEKVHLVAIDLHWYEHSFGALDVARVCKQARPELPVVLGGLTASCFAEDILSEFPNVDFVIRGDGEIPLLKLTEWLCGLEGVCLEEIPNLVYRKGDQVVVNESTYCAAQTDLDSLNFADMDFLIHADQLAEVSYSLSEKVEMDGQARQKGHWLTIGRGCIYNCSYCGGGYSAHKAIAGRHGIIPRSPERVVDDLESLKMSGYQQVSLNLDPAIMGKEFWSNLFSTMRRRQVKMGFYLEHYQVPSDEFIQDLLASVDIPNSELAFSPLSGSEQVRRLNGKHYTNHQLLHLLSLLRPTGMAVFIYFSLNIPGEDTKTFPQTVRLASEITKSYPPQRLRMIDMVHSLDPYSPISRQPQKYGQKVQFKTFKDYYKYCQETPVLKKDLPLSAWRGFRAVTGNPQDLETMAIQWNNFSSRQPSHCYPVPRTW